MSAPTGGMSSTACGTILPYEASAKRSAPHSRNRVERRRANATVRASGCPIPARRASTGVGCEFMPAPRGPIRLGNDEPAVRQLGADVQTRARQNRSSRRKPSAVWRRYLRRQAGSAGAVSSAARTASATRAIRAPRLRPRPAPHAFLGHGLTDVLGLIGVEHAVEMVHLMLQAAPEEPRRLDRDLACRRGRARSRPPARSGSGRRSFPAPRGSLRSTRSRPRSR